MAIEHRIPIIPITFHDNKKRFPYKFFTGGPGKLRVKIHNFIDTKKHDLTCRKELKERTHKIILEELTNPTIH